MYQVSIAYSSQPEEFGHATGSDNMSTKFEELKKKKANLKYYI